MSQGSGGDNNGFLVLSRKVGSSFTILTPDGREIFIRVHEIDGRYAKLAVRAPRDYGISKIEGANRGDHDAPAPRHRGRTSGGNDSED